MIAGLISQELHTQLLDANSYQNRTDAVEELKRVLSEVDIKSVPSDSVVDLINFLPRLLDDKNFQVLYGTLQVLNILIQRLGTSVEKYFKLLSLVAFKALGDACTITRFECMAAFQKLMKTVAPQQVLDLLVSNLKHKKSRVREDVLNIIMAAMLTHPKRDFNIPKLCYEVAPYLADSKKKVRHAALELFAVFDHYLETGKKQPLMKAVDMVELNEDAEGLMAAVQARRARHLLPKLSAEGILEYGLVVAKPGQRLSLQNASGDDLDWVMNGGRMSSARSLRPEADLDLFYGNGSLGSLIDELPLQRRIVSAGKGKSKLPWEMSDFSSTVNDQKCNTSNRASSEQVTTKDSLPLSRRQSPETYIPSFSSAEPQRNQISRSRGPPGRHRRSGSLNLDPDILKTNNVSDLDIVPPEGRMLQRNPSVERTFSLPSNTPTSGSFLLPSYPLAALPGGMLTPTLSRRHGDPSLSMSNTWPNKRESGPQQQDTSPCRETAGTAKGDLFSRCSPRPLLANLVTSPSTSSFRRALSSTRASLSVSPVAPPGEQAHNDQRYNASGSPQNQQLEKSLQLDPDGFSAAQDLQEDDPMDKQEMRNSLRSLHNSAAKKRVQISLGSPVPDSPDSAVRLDLDSLSHTSPKLTSSASESGLSSLSSVADTNSNSPGNSTGNRPRIARVPSAKLRSSVSMDFSSLQGLRNEPSSEVGVVGQRVIHPNETMRTEMETTGPSPPLIRPELREAVRGLKPTKGSQHLSSRTSPGTDMPEGVIGKGVVLSLELGESVAKSPTFPSAGVRNHILNDCQQYSDDSTHSDGSKEGVKNKRFSWDRTHPQHEYSLGDSERERIRQRIRQMLSDSPSEENETSIIKDLHLNGSTLSSPKSDSLSTPHSTSCPDSPAEPQSSLKCLTPPYQPSPPTVPPNPKNISQLRRTSGLRRTQPSPSDSLDLSPISKPSLSLTESFELLNSVSWEKKIEGLKVLRFLAQHHSDILQGRLHDACLIIIQELKNLRSIVCKFAVCTLGDLYTHMQKAMDQELDGTVKALLQKAADTNIFIRQDVDAALDCMVQHCTPTRGINALLNAGPSHLNPLVRKCTSQHLANLVEKVGAARLLSEGKDHNERILPAVTKLAQDSSQEVRPFGRQMLLYLSSHPDFDKLLEKYIHTHDLRTVRETVHTLKTKGQNTQSARGKRSLQGSGKFRSASLPRVLPNHNNREAHSNYSYRSQSIVDKGQYIKQISDQLGSKDFKERIEGINQLVNDCQQNPNMVIKSIFPVFDAFRGRLLESNSKVNLHALESLQKIIFIMKDDLSQVVNILLPAIVDNHLNSKNNAIYSAAVGAIDALISNLDTIHLLQPLCTKAKFLNGKAKVELVAKVADIVTELYHRKPQMVEQKVLPLVWHLLGTPTHRGCGGSVRAATASLCQALYTKMGSSLSEYAASQSLDVHNKLKEFLRAA